MIDNERTNRVLSILKIDIVCNSDEMIRGTVRNRTIIGDIELWVVEIVLDRVVTSRR